MSSKPTTHPRVYETIPNPYPPSNSMAPGSQQPLSFINPGNQAQSGQPPFTTSPGIYTNSQQGQGNILKLNPAIVPATSKFKEEGKTLGAIQIVIGLMHIGFGIILGLICLTYKNVIFGAFASLAFIGGYPFWGGVSFIITGSLSVSASKQFSPGLIKGSLGMNLVSAIFVLFGLILLLIDVNINGIPNQNYWALVFGTGISGMLIIFSLLEFCIACTTAFFASHAIINTSWSVLAIPNVYATSPLPPWSSSAPPRIDGHSANATNY
ncbi:PREDICTED: membrane-spanning 4-domains subfamily A member 12 [Ceratotherium simum simum]|uniref:Membrane-spanning 4-domains subfamily A member 12 n=1 Tax=Ceratotherium simum simum TaxID=73337 RepID=A0ABM0I0Q0_CERSS|nr:PREDICTED: membrane-spanning 4-domains subfamily A member 12 [Ceratotherium simum simum]